MRLITFDRGGRPQVGVRIGDQVLPVHDVVPTIPHSLTELIATGALDTLEAALQREEVMELVDRHGIATDDIEYLPLIPRPGKVLCIGRNYAAHAAEGGADTPTFPEVFVRASTSLIAHGSPIVRPRWYGLRQALPR